MALKKFTGTIPLICKIEYALLSDIETFTKIGTALCAVVLKTGKTWNEIYHTSGSPSMLDKKENTAAGVIYNNEVSFSFPGNNQPDLEEIQALDGVPLIIRLTYSNSLKILIGNMDEPNMMNSDFESRGKTGFLISFRCLSVDRFRYENQ